MLRKVPALTFIIVVCLLIGCSSGAVDATSPVIGGDVPVDTGIKGGDGGHLIWGLYDLYVDLEAMTVDAIPNREAHPHWNVTEFVTPPHCYDCIEIEVEDFDIVTRIMTLYITLRNPTAIDAYDVRGILLLTDAGHDLANPDGWVALFDDGLPPYFNPFMRYGKMNQYGRFPCGEKLSETYQLFLPKPPQFGAIQYVVEAVWPKNCKRESYLITGEVVDGWLYSNGSNSVTFSCFVFDRNDDVLKVTIECPELFDGTKEMAPAGSDEWSIVFTNEKLAEASVDPYVLTIEAYDSVTPYTLRDRASVDVKDKEFFWVENIALQPMGECSFDIAAVTGGLIDGGGYLIDPESECTGFNGFETWFNVTFPAVSLVDINPNNLSLQPYPPVRFDSVVGGGLAFSNSSQEMFEDSAYSVSLDQVVVTLDDDLVFKDDLSGDHQAHYPLDSGTLAVADICDGFIERFYILWAETTGDDLPLIRCYEADYTAEDKVIDTVFPIDFIGEGDGKIINDANALIATDALEVEDTPPIENVELFVLENIGDGSQIEVFNIYTDPSTGMIDFTSIQTIDLPAEMGEACDMELLPPNPDYAPNPDAYSLVVVFKIEYGESYVGYMVIYDTSTGEIVEELGSLDMPVLFENVRHLDINNGTYTIVVTAEIMIPELLNMVSFTFTYM